MAETEDASKTPAGRWKEALEAAKRETGDWRKQGRNVVKRYLDERPSETQGTRYNILWSNTEVMVPATYGQTPEPIVKRRHDAKDPVGREAAEVVERCLRYSISEFGFDDVMEQAVQDMLLPGLGVARVVYEADYEDRQDEAGQDYQAVASEKVSIEHVYWEDFLWGPARRWSSVPWVAFRWKLTRPELERRFGKDKADKIKLDWSPETGAEADSSLTPKEGENRRAMGWEIWDRTKKRVVWIANSSNEILDEKDDPLHLKGFFPCPEPLIEGATTSRWLPQPAYVQYQDQARELDLITAQITALTDGLKVVGLYAGDAKSQIGALLQNAKNNTLIPVADWAALQSKGGLSGLIEWLPLDQVVGALSALYDARDRVKQDLYEITGIADIVRGASDPRETLGAQQIKSRFATLRMEKRQKKVAKFARDLIRLMAEIMAEMFDAATLVDMSGKDLPMTRAEAAMATAPRALPAPAVAAAGAAVPAGGGAVAPIPAAVPAPMAPQAPQEAPEPKPSWEDVVELLRSDRLRSFRVDIETDSTIAPNPEMEQQRRIEFLTAVGGFFQQVGPLVVQGIVPGNVAKEMMSFVVRGFRVGRNLEGTIDEIEAPQAAQPKQDPEIAKLQAQMQLDEQKAAHEAKLKESEFAHQAQLEQQRLGLERQKMVADTALRREQALAELQLKRETALVSEQTRGDVERMKIRAAAGQPVDDQSPRFDAIEQTLGVIMTRFGEFMTAIGERQAATEGAIQQLAGLMAGHEEFMRQQQAQIAAAASRPSSVAFEFGRDGKVAGATFSDGRKATIERKGGRPVAAKITA